MSDIVQIALTPNSGQVPAHLKVNVGDENIFDGNLERPRILEHKMMVPDRLKIEIIKTGKTKAVADSGQPQEVIVDRVAMNGLNLHADKFGNFFQKDNAYLKDKAIDGNILSVNGEWNLDVPVFRQNFVPYMDRQYRDPFQDTEVACFGCSFTYGSMLEKTQTWPYFLGAKNYGWASGGSCISSIIGTAREYIQNYKCDKMVILLPHPCRLQVVDNGVVKTLLPQNISTKDLASRFKDLSRDVVMFGEASLILSGYARTLTGHLAEMCKKTKIYISSYEPDTYECINALQDQSFEVLPFYETSNQYDFAEDNLHPGPDHNQEFANKIGKIIGG